MLMIQGVIRFALSFKYGYIQCYSSFLVTYNQRMIAMDQSILNACDDICTGNICDAGKELVQLMDIGIKPLCSSMKVVGPAYTVECAGENNLAIHQALAQAPAGSVLVINVGGCMKSGHIGDLISTSARLRGIKGIVLDGTCRDLEDIIKMGFPVFARGANPRSNAKLKQGKFNTQTHCGGVKVSPGDIIFGDACGVLVFSQENAPKIIEAAKAIVIKELGVVKQLFEGKTTMEIYGFEKIK